VAAGAIGPLAGAIVVAGAAVLAGASVDDAGTEVAGDTGGAVVVAGSWVAVPASSELPHAAANWVSVTETITTNSTGKRFSGPW